MSRPKGTDKRWAAKKKTIDEMLKTEQWAAKNLKEAREVILDVMRDTEAPATARRGAAETVMNVHKWFYNKHGGKAEYSEYEDKKKDDQEKKKTHEDNGVISLYFDGTDG